MKAGTKVRFKDRIGISHGPVFQYGVWWISVEFECGSKAIVLETSLQEVA